MKLKDTVDFDDLFKYGFGKTKGIPSIYMKNLWWGSNLIIENKSRKICITHCNPYDINIPMPNVLIDMINDGIVEYS